jgi:pyrroline-5-carboxylate reductase
MATELAILGAGNMAEAIAAGVLRGKLLKPDEMIAVDVSAERRLVFEAQLEIATTDDPAAAVKDATIVLLSVKPQQMGALLDAIAVAMDPAQLIVSIAAGISTKFIETRLNAVGQAGGAKAESWRVIRTMPNTPMLIGAGMVAVARGSHATPADAERATELFATAAKVIQVTEDKLDAVTAVSGSGPAYFFLLVEQMIRAGEALGLTPAEARTLSVQTAVGAAKMLAESADSAQELRRKVTSPNGTTHAAITLLQERGADKALADAVQAAGRRSRELGS